MSNEYPPNICRISAECLSNICRMSVEYLTTMSDTSYVKQISTECLSNIRRMSVEYPPNICRISADAKPGCAVRFSIFNIVQNESVPRHINIIYFCLKVQKSLLLVIFWPTRSTFWPTFCASKYSK